MARNINLSSIGIIPCLSVSLLKLTKFFLRTSWKPLTHSSTLFQSADGVNPGSNIDQLIVRTEGIEVVDIVIRSDDDNPHPLHLHGYKFFVLGFGEGNYTGQPLKTKNPLRRDTVQIEAYNWMVLRFQADNPGVRVYILCVS